MEAHRFLFGKVFNYNLISLVVLALFSFYYHSLYYYILWKFRLHLSVRVYWSELHHFLLSFIMSSHDCLLFLMSPLFVMWLFVLFLFY
jgi:hypothetical protein